MSVTIGVDGGQSQIRLRISDGSPETTAAGVSHLEADVVSAIVDSVAAIWDGRDRDVSRLVAGLTTIPADAADRDALASGLAKATGAREVWVGDDSVTAHAGALNGATGIVLSVGTGVACLAIDAGSGAHRSFDGAGYLVGDEGGGFWMGRHGIRAVIAADEGRGPRTSLTRAIESKLGPVEGIGVRLHFNPRAVNTISQVAPVVLAEAAGGDRVAGYIVENAASHLVDTASAAIRFLSPNPDVVVALCGGLVSDAPRLADLVIEGLHGNHPEVGIAMAQGTSLDGASALAGAGSPGPYQDLLTVFRSEP